MHTHLLLAPLCLALLLPALATSQVRQEFVREPQLFEVKADKFLMGTLVEATLIHRDPVAARQILFEAFTEMERVEQVMSSHSDSSELSRVNASAYTEPVRVSDELFGLLSRSKGYCIRSGGLFDVTIGSLTRLWGFSGDSTPVVPDTATVSRQLDLVGCNVLKLNTSDSTVSFAHDGVEVDLGAIAKGYAVDRAAAVIRASGHRNFLVNAGGDLFASGLKSGEEWRVGVKHPRDNNRLLARFNASDEAVVTSGDYERSMVVDGQRYHHILDPRTGFPATASQSISVAAPTAEEADALATILFILGDVDSTFSDVDFLHVGSGGDVSLSPAMARRSGFEFLGPLEDK